VGKSVFFFHISSHFIFRFLLDVGSPEKSHSTTEGTENTEKKMGFQGKKHPETGLFRCFLKRFVWL
jgi:hypothetical protein